MASSSRAVSLIAFVLFVAKAYPASLPAVPSVSDCDESNEFWKAGSSYRYSYSSVTEGTAVGSTDRVTGVKITCNVDLAAVGQCRYILKTPDCSLSEIGAPGQKDNFQRHPRSNEFKEQMAKSSVSFLLNKGEVLNLITNENEPVHVVNLKRGIISTLQGQRRAEGDDDDVVETDIHGTCHVRYEVHDDHIESFKQLSRCRVPSRHDWHLSPSSLVWNMTFLQFFIINATSHCKYDLQTGALAKVECYERHGRRTGFTPDSNSAIQTTITQTMELKSTKNDKSQFDRNLKNKRLTSIRFEWEEHEDATSQPADFTDRALRIVDMLGDSSKLEIRVQSVDLFDDLVDLLRHSNDVLDFTRRAYQRGDAIEDQVAKALTRDALVTCNTAACMKGVSYLAINDHLTSNYLNVLLFKLTKIRITEPEYITEVLEICKAKPTRMCLLSLTSIIHTYLYRNKDLDTPPEISASIRATVQFLVAQLGNRCDSSKALSNLPVYQRLERTILVLKALGNLGDAGPQSNSELIQILKACSSNPNLPANATLEAIKAFRRISPNNQIYNHLIGILRNQQNSIENRVAAYLVLVSHHHDAKLFEDIAKILKNENNQQLGNFITMHMINVQTHGDSSLENLKGSMQAAMADHEDIFVVQGNRPLTSSRQRERAFYFNSPYISELVNRFGYDFTSSVLHESSTYLPKEWIFNLTTTLFGKTFNTATLTSTFKGLEPYLEVLFGPQGIFKDAERLTAVLNDAQSQGSELFQKLQDPVGFMTEAWTPHFDATIEDKLDKIHNSVIFDYGDSDPSATFSLKLYGDELAFTSFDLIKDRILSFIEEMGTINWDEPHEYHVHRVIRFLEGSSQVPTISGLPLYFKANGNLGLSIRSAIKADIFGLLQNPPFLNADWDINTSFASTIITSMTVDVHGFTQLGFRANNTFYRSRQRKGDLLYMEGDFTINLHAPPRPQQVFNYFRDNKLIRGDNLEDIPDHDVQRTNAKYCSPGYSGIKFCRSKNYASSSDSSRPLIPLLGDVDYRIWFEVDDPGLKMYTIKLHKHWKGTTITYDFQFEAPGNKGRREVKGSLSRNRATNEFNINLAAPAKPHLKFNAVRTRKNDGYKTHVEVQVSPGNPIHFHAESGTETAVKKSESGKATTANVKQMKADLTLTGRKYSWVRTLQDFSGGDKELDHHFSYESSESSYGQEHRSAFIPDFFWETPNKAWVQIHSKIEVEMESGWERQTNNYIKTPKSILEVNTQRIRDTPDRRSLHINITRKELPSNRELSYVHLNYDMHITPMGDLTKRTHQLRLAIPSVQWTLETSREMNNVDNNIYAELKRTKEGGNTWNAIFQLKHHNVSAARGDVFPTPRERDLEFSLDYPRDGARHTLSYKGKLINDEGQRNAIRSFKTDSEIDSTYWQINWKANTDYIRTETRLGFDHRSDITSRRTQKTATYVAHLDANRALPIEFNQNFQSSFYTFDEKLKVSSSGNKVNLNLDIKANSPIWDGLNVDLKQTLDIDRDGISTDTVHFSHKLFDVDVNAEFRLPFGSYYKKTFDIKSKNQVWPSMKWILDHHDNRFYSVHVEYPDDPEKKNIYGILEMDPNLKGTTLTVSHNKAGQPNQTAIQWSLTIVRPDMVIVKCESDANALRRMADIYSERFKKTAEAWRAIKSDPEHPMNKLLKPIVKTTLADFQEELRERSKARRQAIREALIDAFRSLEPIYGPALQVVRSFFAVIERFALRLGEDRPQTFIGWAWTNYRIPERIREYFRNLAERIAARSSTFQSTGSDGSVAIRHPFYWNSLMELPRGSPRFQRILDGNEKAKLHRPDMDFKRVAVAFGADHIYTFDGKTYTFPGFVNKDCMFLLAHDFVFRRYSLLMQDGNFHALFPEIAVSINKNGQVRVNGSKSTESLPISSYNDHVVVTQSADSLILIHTEYGINIKFLPRHGFYIFYADFWNHNRTLGLLGNNDNEPRNDFKTLKGKLANDVYEFLPTYELSGRPVCVDKKKLVGKKACTMALSVDCESLFAVDNYKSPLYKCFDTVKPEAFSLTCQEDFNCGANFCDSVAAYATACFIHGIYLDVDDICPMVNKLHLT